MDELTAVRQLLADQPQSGPEVAIRARARLDHAMAGGGAFGPKIARRPRRLLPAAGLAAVVTAGCLIAFVVGGSRTAPASALTVRQLADRAAAAAARQPDVRPGQWVFWRERLGGPGCGTCFSFSFRVWTTADSQRAALVYKGKVIKIGPGPFIGQPVPDGNGYGSENGKLPVSYARLSSLPRDPVALDRYFGRLHLPGWGSRPVREFSVIEELLMSYVTPPRLTAEMYQALGAIPGVAVSNDAVDVAGRHGVGFISPSENGGFHEMIILNQRTYSLMGHDLMGEAHFLESGTAILREQLVSGPGIS